MSENNVLHTLIASLTAMLEKDGSTGAKAPKTNVNTPSVPTGTVFTSLLANIGKLARTKQLDKLQVALKHAFEGVTRRDIEQNRTSQYFVGRTAGKWISNVGGMNAFREQATRLYGANVGKVSVPSIVAESDLRNMCNTYFHDRVQAGTGFVTPMTIVGKGVYKGNPVAIVRKGKTDIMYALGNLFDSGVKATRGKKIVAEIMSATTYSEVKPVAVFVPKRS